MSNKIIVIPLSLVMFILITVFLLVHHGITHDGNVFDFTDFANSGNSLISSHEGLILLTMILVIGIMIGGILI